MYGWIVMGTAAVYWVPLYYPFKIMLLFWCMLPQFRGCDMLHRGVFTAQMQAQAQQSSEASISDTASGDSDGNSSDSFDSGHTPSLKSSLSKLSAVAVVAAAASKRSVEREACVEPERTDASEVSAKEHVRPECEHEHEYVDIMDGPTPSDTVVNTDPGSVTVDGNDEL